MTKSTKTLTEKLQAACITKIKSGTVPFTLPAFESMITVGGIQEGPMDRREYEGDAFLHFSLTRLIRWLHPSLPINAYMPIREVLVSNKTLGALIGQSPIKFIGIEEGSKLQAGFFKSIAGLCVEVFGFPSAHQWSLGVYRDHINHLVSEWEKYQKERNPTGKGKKKRIHLPGVTSIVIPEPEQAELRSLESNAISVPTVEFTFSAPLILANSNGVPNSEPFVGTSPPANFTVRRYSQRLPPNQIGAVANEHVPNTHLARLLPVHTVVIEPVFPTVPQQTHEAFASSICRRSSDPTHGEAQTIDSRSDEPPTSSSHTNMSMALPSIQPLSAQHRSRSISVVALIAEKSDKRLSSAVRIRSVSSPPSYVFLPH